VPTIEFAEVAGFSLLVFLEPVALAGKSSLLLSPCRQTVFFLPTFSETGICRLWNTLPAGAGLLCLRVGPPTPPLFDFKARPSDGHATPPLFFSSSSRPPPTCRWKFSQRSYCGRGGGGSLGPFGPRLLAAGGGFFPFSFFIR